MEVEYQSAWEVVQPNKAIVGKRLRTVRNSSDGLSKYATTIMDHFRSRNNK
jgi:hypothetical protein